MDVIRHYDIRVEAIMLQSLFTVMECLYDHRGDIGQHQPRGTVICAVEIAIDPSESCPAAQSFRRDVTIGGKTAMQAPGDEKIAAFGMPVGEAAGVHDRLDSARK